MSEEEFFAQFGLLDANDQHDEYGQAGTRCQSNRPDGKFQLAEIVLTGGQRFITRVPDPVSLDDLPSLPPAEPTEVPDEFPPFLKGLFEQANQNAREQAASQMVAAVRYDSMQRITAQISAGAQRNAGWFDCFTADGSGRLVAILEHNIAYVRIMSEDEADDPKHDRARNGG